LHARVSNTNLAQHIGSGCGGALLLPCILRCDEDVETCRPSRDSHDKSGVGDGKGGGVGGSSEQGGREQVKYVKRYFEEGHTGAGCLCGRWVCACVTAVLE
jgi:hypothetical protein